MNQCKILIPQSCRSDEGLSAPVIKELCESDKFDVSTIHLVPNDFIKTNDIIFTLLRIEKPDILFITGDRTEMMVAAMTAFHMNVPIAHFYAGVLSPAFMTYDTINRHAITLWSDIQFVESKLCMLNVEMLCNSIKKKSNSKVVGISHMENIKISEKLVPEHSYNLFLYNETTKRDDIVIFTFDDKNHFPTIWIGGNPDGDNKQLKKEAILFGDQWYDNVPRDEFFGLLKNCSEFITNSSAAYYEAPYFLKAEQIIMVGERNAGRTKTFFKPEDYHASVKIRKHLEYWWEAHDY